jgi:hypothetical protein
MSLGSYSCGLEEETLMRASASHVVVNSSTFTVLPLQHDAYFQTVEHTGVVWAHRRPTVDFAARILAYVSGAFGEGWRQVFQLRVRGM